MARQLFRLTRLLLKINSKKAGAIESQSLTILMLGLLTGSGSKGRTPPLMSRERATATLLP